MIQTVNHRGRTWQIDDGDNRHVQWLINELPTWEADTFDTIDQYVKGGVFVDVGAWVGIFTLYAAPLAERVIAIEPDPVALNLLRENLELNNITNVLLLEGALWVADGTTALTCYGDEWGDSMSGLGREGSLKTAVLSFSPQTVKALAGDSIDLVKVDIEGAEAEVVPELLRWRVPMHVSLHEHEMSRPIDWRERPVTTLVDHPSYPTVLVGA